MGFEIKVSGLTEATSKFSGLSGAINQAVAKAMNKAGETIANYAANKVRENESVDTEKLAKSIAVTQKATELSLETVIAPKVGYGVYVEKGTRPHFPPIAAITPWAKRKGISPFLVARSIARKGTKAKPFMAPAAQEAPKMVATEVEGAIKNVLEKG